MELITGPLAIGDPGFRDILGDRLSEADREAGAVAPPFSLKSDGCCRIRRKPERPRPCSPACSGIIGDLSKVSDIETSRVNPHADLSLEIGVYDENILNV
jgi:hypothetical protein